ncbi:1-deoxy-11-beta-hydroxypentalenate dehydrogenase [Paraconexibacter sp. AEG42_29]|uniref:1-deoxy-11-beta-hydroxypentalenate dehydrogenase n=1 Tax=Paraconexibacter sp. AEG42_29 TaxID=2997339 RepID=A0AAU7ARY6_9ACTN
MKLEGSIVLVTGANRGLGLAFTDALLAAGAAKVYAGARDPATVAARPGVVPIALDITRPADVAAAVEAAGDVTVLINNAGVATGTNVLSDDGLEGAREEMEVNYFGHLAMSRAFAPVLAANGGGALVNVLSALSWVAFPQYGNYCSAKSATWSLTNSLRTLLRGQGTLVSGLHLGYADTDMTAGVTAPKVAPADVAAALVAGLTAGDEEILADDTSRAVKSALSSDLDVLYADIQAGYDAAVA